MVCVSCLCVCVFDIFSTRKPIEKQIKNKKKEYVCYESAKRATDRKREREERTKFQKCSFFRLTIWNWFANFRNLIKLAWEALIWAASHYIYLILVSSASLFFFIYAKSCLKLHNITIIPFITLSLSLTCSLSFIRVRLIDVH